jgi:hypothetical protein
MKFSLGNLSIAESAIMKSYISKFNNDEWNYPINQNVSPDRDICSIPFSILI